MWLLLSLALADPDADVALLAPIPADLREQLGDTERALLIAGALGEAVARLQNDWVEAGFGDKAPACTVEAAASIGARSRAFGASYRDAVELAGTRATRLALLPDAPTLAPLVTDDDRRRLAAVATSVAHERIAYLEAAAWHARHLAPFVKRCAPALLPVGGVPRAEHRAVGEASRATAIATSAPGRICTPTGQSDASGVVVILGDRACFSETCECEPAPVAPGAVLGP